MNNNASKRCFRADWFYSSLKIPKNLKEAGVEKDKLKYLAQKATEFGNLGALCKIEEKEALEIFEMAYE